MGTIATKNGEYCDNCGSAHLFDLIDCWNCETPVSVPSSEQQSVSKEPSDKFILGLRPSELLVGVTVAVLCWVYVSVINYIHKPALVGFGCSDSQGLLYAEEEDHFPSSCTRIVRQ